MNKKTIRLSCVAVLCAVFASAQTKDTLATQLKEVVVSATKFATPKEKLGKIIEVISKEDLANKQGQSLATVLSQVAGVEINGNQSAGGKNLSYFIRGGRSRQVAIYIDGVPVTDASGINLQYDLRLLPVEQIEQIEILKGASSTLYGSGAATGVINITLKKATDKALGGQITTSFGSQNTADDQSYKAQDVNQSLFLSGKKAKWNYITQLNRTEQSGMSEAVADNATSDPFSRISIAQRVGYAFNASLSTEIDAAFDKTKNGFDAPFSGSDFISDVEQNESESEQFRLRWSSNFKFKKGELQWNNGFTSLDRNINQFSSWDNTVLNYKYASQNLNSDVFVKYQVANYLDVISGVQYQYLSMAQEDPYTSIAKESSRFIIADPYFSFVYTSQFGMNINAGTRLNTHSVYGNQWVYNFNPSFSFKNVPLKLMSSYSTAYITPSLYQLYSPFGNLELTPEENETAEFGFETHLLNRKIELITVVFYRNESNRFGFFTNPDTFASNYINERPTFNAKGIEFSLKYSLFKNVTLQTNYTFTEVDATQARLIAKHAVNATLDYTLNSKFTLNVGFQFRDKRTDAYYDNSTFATEEDNLAAYKLFSLSGRYTLLTNRLVLNAAVFNIANESFTETIGYNTRGRNVKLGLQVMF
jgi:vitamin B12 transporter